jgi:hypothetical protein
VPTVVAPVLTEAMPTLIVDVTALIEGLSVDIVGVPMVIVAVLTLAIATLAFIEGLPVLTVAIAAFIVVISVLIVGSSALIEALSALKEAYHKSKPDSYRVIYSNFSLALAATSIFT